MTASIINPWLFKRDRNGAIRRWALKLDGATYRTLSGIVDGAIAKSGFTTCLCELEAMKVANQERQENRCANAFNEMAFKTRTEAAQDLFKPRFAKDV